MLTATLSPSMDSSMIAINQNAKSSGNLLKLKTLSKGATLDKIDDISHEFEGQFISQLLGNMFSTVDPADALGGSEEEGEYRSMLIDQYGKIIAKTGGIGVADQVKREMLKLQEVGEQNATASTPAA
jgi:flagellar protein FlgJ